MNLILRITLTIAGAVGIAVPLIFGSEWDWVLNVVVLMLLIAVFIPSRRRKDEDSK